MTWPYLISKKVNESHFIVCLEDEKEEIFEEQH